MISIEPIKVRVNGKIEFVGDVTKSQMEEVYITADNGKKLDLSYGNKVATFE